MAWMSSLGQGGMALGAAASAQIVAARGSGPALACVVPVVLLAALLSRQRGTGPSPR